MDKLYWKHTNYKDIEDFKRLDFIINAVNSLNNPGAKILDVGCGNGNISLALGSLGYIVHGIDIDADSIEKARQRNTFDNIRFNVLDANSFDLNDEYDIVVCSEVLEHLNNPTELIGSIKLILRKQGIFIATVPNGYGPREVLITKPMQWLHRKKLDRFLLSVKKFLGYSNHTRQSSNPDLTHVQFFTARGFRNTLEKSGFKILKWQNADFIERIFPYSWFTKRVELLQKIDCAFADYIPRNLSSGFYTAWVK